MIYHYTDNDIPMVEVHVDDLYKYDQIEEGLPVLGPYGGNLSVRKPEGKKPVVTFGQDEAIFRSSQLNESCWQIDGVTTLRTKGLGVGLMVSAMTSRAFGLGMDIMKPWEAKKIKFPDLLGRTRHLKSADFSTLKFQVLIVRLYQDLVSVHIFEIENHLEKGIKEI